MSIGRRPQDARVGPQDASSAAGTMWRGRWELALPAGFYQQAPQTYTEESCVYTPSPPRSICLPTCLNTEGAKCLPSSSSSSHPYSWEGGRDSVPWGDRASQGRTGHLSQEATAGWVRGPSDPRALKGSRSPFLTTLSGQKAKGAILQMEADVWSKNFSLKPVFWIPS